MAPAFAISRTVALVHFNRTGKPDLFVYFVSFVVVISNTDASTSSCGLRCELRVAVVHHD
jgi:hypothetical protein